MTNAIKYDLRTGRTFATSDGLNGKALEMFINLQTPFEMRELEEKLRDLLQGKTDQYVSLKEHTKIFANRKTAFVKDYFIPFEGPVQGPYSTKDVYELACEYNLTEHNMAVISSGGHLASDPRDDIRKKMELVSDIPADRVGLDYDLKDNVYFYFFLEEKAKWEPHAIYDYETGRTSLEVFEDSYIDEFEKPLQLYINRLEPDQIGELEVILCGLLQGEKDRYENGDEKIRICADKEEIEITCDVPEAGEYKSGTYVTKYVYGLVCEYTVTAAHMSFLRDSGQLQTDPAEEYEKKMALAG